MLAAKQIGDAAPLSTVNRHSCRLSKTNLGREVVCLRGLSLAARVGVFGIPDVGSLPECGFRDLIGTRCHPSIGMRCSGLLPRTIPG